MNIKNLIRKNILDLKPYTSARDENSSGILLDANENSLGSTFNEIKDLNLNRYPDPNQNDLRDLISAYLDVSKENLFFGVGSDEIIDLLIRIFCEPGKDKILIPEPTYGMYKVTADINNVPAVRVLLNDDFQIDLKEINKNFTRDIKIIFLCSPNNPTGNLLRKDDVLGLCKKNNSIVIVDEAYIDFAESFSLTNEEIVKILFKVKATYNINSLTRFAIGKALNNVKLKNSYVKTIIEERENLKKELLLLPGVSKVFDSDANFLLIKCTNAKTILKKLAERKIIIRDRSSQPKLEGCLRISVGTKEENKILLNALKGILK